MSDLMQTDKMHVDTIMTASQQPTNVGPTIRHVCIRIWRSIAADNLSLLAAGVAFYSLLAIFPGLAFIVAMFGLIADPNQVQQQLLSIQDAMPQEAWAVLDAQLKILTRQTSTSLSLTSVVSIVLAFINARLAAYAMMGAMNVIYKRPETRSFVKVNAIAFLFTVAAMGLLALNVVALVSMPEYLQKTGILKLSHAVTDNTKWPILALFMAFSLMMTYRFGPARPHANWKWLLLGAFTATILWVIGTSLFSWYVSTFNSYDKLYGAFGAVVVLLYWFWLTAFVAMIGAELDMQIEIELKDIPR